MQSPILKDKHHRVVFNGVDTEIFHPLDAEDLREKHSLGDAKVLFHATPFFTDDPEYLKGGYYVLRLAEQLADENVKVLVAGDYAPGLRVPGNVILLGRIGDQKEMARYYSLADVTVLTSKRETFSMVTAESLCCGTPVAGFRAGGPEQIAIPEFSRFVPWGDTTELSDALKELLNQQVSLEIGEYAVREYSRDTMTEGYISLYAK